MTVPPRTPVSPNLAAIAEMQTLLRATLAPLCAGHDRYALLDFPAHPNVGDSAIYAGEVALLDALFGRPADYVCDLYSHFGDIDRRVPGGLIFLHGGGNFGDIWPWYQTFREAVIAAYPGHRIVQLPQTLKFHDTAARDRCARVIEGHPDFTLLVRDRESLALAEAHFDCRALLCPDAAYMIGAIGDRGPARHAVLSMLRSDRESAARDGREALAEFGPIEDWLDERDPVTTADRVVGRAIRHLPALRGALMPLRERAYRRQARARIDRGLDQLATADTIVSDRLHVHILSVLLGKPHIVVDNSYRKIGNFIDAWPDDGLTRQAGSLAQARAMLEGDADMAAPG